MSQRGIEFGSEDGSGPEAGYVHILAQKKRKAEDMSVFNRRVAPLAKSLQAHQPIFLGTAGKGPGGDVSGILNLCCHGN